MTRIQPNPITITLSPTITATLPIKPVVAGSPPEGYELKGIKPRPDRVTVIGPADELTDLKFIPTHPIDVRHLTETTVIATDLDFKNLHLTLKNQIAILAELDIQPKNPDAHPSGGPGDAGARSGQPAAGPSSRHRSGPLARDEGPEARRP